MNDKYFEKEVGWKTIFRKSIWEINGLIKQTPCLRRTRPGCGVEDSVDRQVLSIRRPKVNSHIFVHFCSNTKDAAASEHRARLVAWTLPAPHLLMQNLFTFVFGSLERSLGQIERVQAGPILLHVRKRKKESFPAVQARFVRCCEDKVTSLQSFLH